MDIYLITIENVMGFDIDGGTTEFEIVGAFKTREQAKRHLEIIAMGFRNDSDYQDFEYDKEEGIFSADNNPNSFYDEDYVIVKIIKSKLE